MPLYGYLCLVCGHEVDQLRPIEKRRDGPECCGRKMQLDVSGPYVRPDIEAYYDYDLETPIKSRQHHREVMRERDVADKRDYKGTRWRN